MISPAPVFELTTASRPRGDPAPDRVTVVGGRPLHGTISVEGCKISSVTILAATLLTDDVVSLENVPDVLDVSVLLESLGRLGADVEAGEGGTRVRCRDIDGGTTLPEDLVGSVHGTLYLLPALLIRNGSVAIPRTWGGCAIGSRPVSHVLRVLRAFGATVPGGEIVCARLGRKGLMGARLDLEEWYGPRNNKFVSGATKTAILAGVLARGETVIRGAYWRSPIVHLCRFLRAMGAEIEGEGTRCIRIRGRDALHGTHFSVPFDRLVLGTYVAAAAATRGSVTCHPCGPEGWEVEAAAFREAGVEIRAADDGKVTAVGPERLRPVKASTEHLDTDLGPLFAVLMTLAEEELSMLEEVIWENRFRYAVELRRMGARNRIAGRTLHVTGVGSLRPARVGAHDLRGAAALLLATLATNGQSEVTGTSHLRRGYGDLLGGLRSLGADIRTAEVP